MAEQKKNVRIWTATRDAQAGMMVKEDSAYMVADRKNFIATTREGTIISANSVVFNLPSDAIREGGLFVRMNDMVRMIPTTLVTPMSQHIPFPPFGFAFAIAKDLEFFYAMSNIV